MAWDGFPWTVHRRIPFPDEKHWEYQEQPLTRYFGGLTREFQTDVGTLARGIVGAGVKMEYILFDDCYMSSVEVAYELKEATRFLIASTSEMMAYGMPYATVGEFLLGNPDYGSLCEGFHDFYSTYEMMPCGTLAVTDCSELDNMAAIMKVSMTGMFSMIPYKENSRDWTDTPPSSFMTLPIMSSPSALTLS